MNPSLDFISAGAPYLLMIRKLSIKINVNDLPGVLGLPSVGLSASLWTKEGKFEIDQTFIICK